MTTTLSTTASVAEHLVLERRQAGRTRTQLAALAGLSVTELGRLERGQSVPTAAQVADLARALWLDEPPCAAAALPDAWGRA